MSNNMIWHPASELPPLHEESFEDDGVIFKSMLSDWVLVRDDTCADTLDDPYTAPVRVSRFCRDSNGTMWDDCTGRRSTVTCWMPLPELPEGVNHG